MRIRSMLSIAPIIFMSCGSSTLTSPTERVTANIRSGGRPSIAVGGDPVVTPGGELAIYPHRLGYVDTWHLRTAESSWHHVAPCIGVSVDSLHRFPILLLESGGTCGGISGGAPGCAHDTDSSAGKRVPAWVEIIGASWDFDPRDPGATPGPTAEIARLWRHELIHVALGIRDGDMDGPHENSAAWACEVSA